ncbi:hypothetical protein GGQ84_000961 [Desulfitispora alkaliphila]
MEEVLGTLSENELAFLVNFYRRINSALEEETEKIVNPPIT